MHFRIAVQLALGASSPPERWREQRTKRTADRGPRQPPEVLA
jgi:hypothetical protein